MKKVFIFISILLACHFVTAQETYYSSKFSYSLEIPTAWKQIPNAQVRNHSKNSSSNYDAGFYPKRERGQFWGFPYVLSSFVPVDLSNLSYEQAARKFISGTNQQLLNGKMMIKNALDFYTKAKPGDVYYDRMKQRLYLVMKDITVDGEPVNILGVVHFSKRGILMIYCNQEEGQNFTSLFCTMINSVELL